ncbi:MAG TPA: hypothetical protein VFU50_16470 [Terriglobales bacterium]|nr:hypothetical protein [Terriglobales bacterium]
MKKKKVDGSALTPAVDGSGQERDARLNRAIETVFRLTHSREMTPKERREFGLKHSNSNHKQKAPAQKGAAKGSRLRASRLESSEFC